VQGQIATVPALYHLHCDQWLARKYGNWRRKIYCRRRIQRTQIPLL
jgi:hypothetical protein